MTKSLRAGEDITGPTDSPTAPTAVSHAQHTPGPWGVTECSGIHDHMVVDSMGVVIAEISDADGRYAANAAFIVRACNHHDALLAALKALLSECEHASVVDMPLSFHMRAIVDARTAILNAEAK